MFRTKKDVDRHVQNIFSKLQNDNEKNLRCYNVAKLYYQVGDYESTKRYVSSYLEVRDNSAGARKLLGQAYEALGQKEAALNEYKTSLELEAKQDDLVLKVCELLVDTDIGMNINKVKYWLDRADKQFPHHPVVFQLKEKLLKVERPNNNCEDLEKLIASELAARPTDVQLRIKLLCHYMSQGKLDKACEHATNVESTVCHRNSIVWYQLLYELLTKCKETKSSDWNFWLFYISVSDRYAALALREQGNDAKTSYTDAVQAVFNFDQNLSIMKSNFSKQHAFTDYLLNHMWGQLHFYLACLLLRKTKREQGSWSEAGRLCAPLFLTALHTAPMDNCASIYLENTAFKDHFGVWTREAAYRCCQAGYILQDYAKDCMKKLMDKIDKFCTGAWKERVYQRIFVTRIHLDHMRKSFFCTHSVPDPPLRFCASKLNHYNQLAQEVWPASLHHQIWLGLENRPQQKDAPYPDQYSHIFPALQFSVFNTNQAAPDSLCLIDVDAFLNAAILCSSAILEEQQLGNFVNPEKLPTLPIDLTTTLSTSVQEKWWSAACKMYTNRENVDENIGELRQELQQGLEVVRCIGNHGMHPILLVHLARMFHHRAKTMREKDEENGQILRWETRSELYWTAAIPLLERLQNNQTLRMSPSKLFNYQGKDMNNFELTNALEEGKLLLAQRLVREKQYEHAIDALQVLKCPEASFQQAKIYKIFADEIVNSTPRESLTSEMRSQHVIMLSKARNCYYLTLDRLRSPGMNPKHPLNAELGTHITDIENELKRIDPDLGRGDLSRNDVDGVSDESYSSAHSVGEQPVNNSALPIVTTLNNSPNILGTPQKNAQRVPKQASSTPYRSLYQDHLNLSRTRMEARPSPERLDAQIRQMMQSRDNEMQELTEQMKNMMEQTKNMMTQMKTLTEKMDTLAKEVMESRKENQKQQQQQQQQQQRVQQQQNVNPPVEPDDFCILDDDEFADLSYQTQSTGLASAISGNIFAPQHRQSYHPLYPPPPTIFQGYYPFDPNAQAGLPSLYPHLYPMSVLYPNQSKVPENPQQGLFGSAALPSQLSDLMSAATASAAAVAAAAVTSPANLQKLEMPRTKPETILATPIIKDAPVNKTPPVNVVITSSDTLPTTAPPVQPTLSVTIPPQHRLGSGPVVTSSSPMSVATATAAMTVLPATSTTTTVKPTSMPSNAPHCYQIPMPSHATIPTTVNLPPTTFYMPPYAVNIPSTYVNSTSSPQSVTTTSQATISSALSSAQSKADNTVKPTYESIGSPNTSAELYGEQEHDPIPDFVPVIPLPAKVKVFTGEEDEDTLYSSRAKLFRFVDKEWKERGVGYVKLLRNAEGKVRLLMRRDQVLKICANHMLRPEMELIPLANNDKAWCWFANDYADEEMKLEKLCIRFKTAEEATAFKEAFDQAKLTLPASPEKPSKTVDRSSVTSASDAFKLQKSQSTQQVNKTGTTTETDKPKSGTTTLGGFSFSSKPIVQEVRDADSSDTKKPEEPPKVSPFSGFSFTVSANKFETATTTTSNSTPTGFVFSVSSTTPSQLPESNQGAISTASFGQNITPLRRPHPPGGAKSASVSEETRSQNENERKLFSGKMSLHCQDVNLKQSKTKRTGLLTLLLDTKSGKLRLLLTDDGNSNVYGHEVPLDMTFMYKAGTMVVKWTTPEGRESGKNKLLHTATFRTQELAAQFHSVVSSCQQKLAKGCGPCEVAKELEKGGTPAGRTSSSENKSQAADRSRPLSEMFKPPVGSWECGACYTRNDAAHTRCAACGALSPLAGNKTSSTSKSSDSGKPPLSELFKPPADSWECGACYTRNDAAHTKCIACEATSPLVGSRTNESPGAGKPPLSELFKQAAGSWPCPDCRVVNSGSNVYCVACDKPKDPSQPPKPQQTGIFQLSSSSSPAMPITTFSFGIPKDAAKDVASGTGFSFQMSKTEDKSDNVKTSAPAKSEETASGFVFGEKQTSIKPNSSSSFTFGSPNKTFGFNFTSKSPVKSPGGGGENSEDEVVENDDIHFSPIVPLPDKIEVKTGEEDEEVLYSHRAKLFRFDVTVKQWKERGLGDIKLLRHKETGKLRLIMRRDHVLKLCLNHLLTADLEFTPKDEKTWLWTTADYSEGEIEYMQFACRFKTPEIAGNFKRAIDDARGNAKPPIAGGAGSSEKPDEPVTTGTPARIASSAEEIEIVYEAKVSPEEKEAALKLQLPENFYSYKQKEDCTGCIGCKEPGIVLYSDSSSQGSTKWNPLPEEKAVTAPKTDSVKLTSSTATPSVLSDSKTTEITQSATVKGEFLATTRTTTPGTTFKTPAPPVTTNIFDGSTMSFGTGDLKLFNDKKTMTFSFGMNPQFNANETEKTPTASLENARICSPSGIQNSTVSSAASVTGQPVFSQAASTGSVFKTSPFSFDASKSIFGGASNATSPPIFGGNSNSTFDNSTFMTAKTTAVTAGTVAPVQNAPSSTASIALKPNSFLFSPPTSNANDTVAPTADPPGQSINSVFATGTSSFPKMTFGASNTSPFGSSITQTTNIFGGTPTTTSASIFGGATPNIFSETTAKTTIASVSGATSATTPTVPNIFGRASSAQVFGEAVTKNLFGGTSATAPTIFGGTLSTTATMTTTTPATTNIFSTTPVTTTTSSVFSAQSSDNAQKSEESGAFFSNGVSFSTLAASVAQPEAFKVDPNFQFAGTGSSVFSSKSNTSLNSSVTTYGGSARKEDNEEEEEADNEQEHDPQFEPIIPLPDAIEVRTGEEEEEKIFYQRAKLFRYNNTEKEWKERGVGEMKILHHAGHGSYRLLLRREQVHKVVCNFLITPDVEFMPNHTSDKVWVWAGMNYADEEPAVEQLAVRFKTPELAQEFKAHIDKIQQELLEKKNAQGEKYEETEEEHDRGNDEEEDDGEEVDEEEEEDDDEDDQEMLPIIEKHVTLYSKYPKESQWKFVASGNLAIHYDSEIFAERIIFKNDDAEDEPSVNTIISADSVMTVEDKDCTWSGIDYALEVPTRRTLRAIFSSEQEAQEMYTFFQDGVVSARQAGVVEYQEY